MITKGKFVQGVTYMLIVVTFMIALGGVTGYCDAGNKIIDGVLGSMNSISTNVVGGTLIGISILFFMFLAAFVAILTFEKKLYKIISAVSAVYFMFIFADNIGHKDGGWSVAFFKWGCEKFTDYL